MSVPRYRSVVFDLDGTVVDSVDLTVASWSHATRKILGMELDRSQVLINVGKPLMDQMVAVDQAHAEELFAAYREFNHREHARMIRLYAGASALLRALRDSGAALGIVTSRTRYTTQMVFDATGIEGLFDAVVCADEAPRSKPDPDPILLCLEQLRSEPRYAVYVGDSPYDIQAARAAGVAAVAVTWGVFPVEVLGAEQPDRLVSTMDELRKVLGLDGTATSSLDRGDEAGR